MLKITLKCIHKLLQDCCKSYKNLKMTSSKNQISDRMERDCYRDDKYHNFTLFRNLNFRISNVTN